MIWDLSRLPTPLKTISKVTWAASCSSTTKMDSNYGFCSFIVKETMWLRTQRTKSRKSILSNDRSPSFSTSLIRLPGCSFKTMKCFRITSFSWKNATLRLKLTSRKSSKIKWPLLSSYKKIKCSSKRLLTRSKSNTKMPISSARRSIGTVWKQTRKWKKYPTKIPSWNRTMTYWRSMKWVSFVIVRIGSSRKLSSSRTCLLKSGRPTQSILSKLKNSR